MPPGRRGAPRSLGAAALGALACLVGCGGEDGPAGARLADTGPELDGRLPASLARGSTEALDVELEVISGTLPDDAIGHAFWVGAVPAGDGSAALAGETTITRVDFADGTAALRSAVVQTASTWADQATAGTNWAFETAGLRRRSADLGLRDLPNAGVVPMGDRLLVAGDASRPYEIDPDSLETVTPIGALSEWEPAVPRASDRRPLPLVQASGHPFFDPDSGELLMVNWTGTAVGATVRTDLVRWFGLGPLEHIALVQPNGSAVAIQQSVHQLAVTRHWILIADTAFLVEPEQEDAPGTMRPQAADTTLWIVRRADLGAGPEVVARPVTVPREMLRFLADFDDDDGVILHAVHPCASDASEWVRPDDAPFGGAGPVRAELAGVPVAPMDVSVLGRYTIDPEAAAVVDEVTTSDESVGWGPVSWTHRGNFVPLRVRSMFWTSAGFAPEAQTARVHSTYRDYAHRTVALSALPTGPVPSAVFRVDTEALAVGDAWRLPPGRVAQAPVYVRNGEAHGGLLDGYLVVPVVSDDDSAPSGDELWIFEAANLAQGPLCRLGHERLDLAVVLHGAWLPSTAPRQSTYAVSARADYGPGLSEASPEIQQLFEDEVFSHLDP